MSAQSHPESRVLLIEDNAEDAELILATLKDEAIPGCSVQHEQTLHDGLARLRDGEFAAILLDLSLPDSDYTETLKRVREQAPSTPIVIVSGAGDEQMIREALRGGAQDYLVKDHLNPFAMRRSLGFEMERQRLLEELATERRERELLSRDHARLESMLVDRPAETTASIYGDKPLRDRQSEAFDELVEAYERLLATSLDRRVLRANGQDPFAPDLHRFTDDLGSVRAGARDVLEIHACAMKEIGAKVNARRAAAYSEEARYMLIQVLGRLVGHYRLYAHSIADTRDKDASGMGGP